MPGLGVPKYKYTARKNTDFEPRSHYICILDLGINNTRFQNVRVSIHGHRHPRHPVTTYISKYTSSSPHLHSKRQQYLSYLWTFAHRLDSLAVSSSHQNFQHYDIPPYISRLNPISFRSESNNHQRGPKDSSSVCFRNSHWSSERDFPKRILYASMNCHT